MIAMVQMTVLDCKHVFVPEPVPQEPQDPVVKGDGAESGEAGHDLGESQGDEPQRDAQQDDQREEIGEPDSLEAHRRLQHHLHLVPDAIGGGGRGGHFNGFLGVFGKAAQAGGVALRAGGLRDDPNHRRLRGHRHDLTGMHHLFPHFTRLLEMRAVKSWASPS